MMKTKFTRNNKKKIKTAKGRKISSTLWLSRQLKDPYVNEAKQQGYRSRAAFKLIEVNTKYKILHPQMNIIDLGAAPGSWCQASVKLAKNSNIIGVDLQEIEPITGVTLIQGDFFSLDIQKQLSDFFPEGADLILSDMAPSSCGHAATDHLRIISLGEEALEFCKTSLRKGGSFLIKMLKGSEEQKFFNELRKHFGKVSYAKPGASRSESRETFILATKFKG